MFGYNNYGYNMPNVNPYYNNGYGECPSGHSPDSNAIDLNKYDTAGDFMKTLNDLHVSQPRYCIDGDTGKYYDTRPYEGPSIVNQLNGETETSNNQQSYNPYQPQYQQANNMYYNQPQQQPQETNAYLNYLQQNNGYSYNPNQYTQQTMAYQQPQMQQQETNPYLRYQQEQYYAQQQYQNQMMMNNYYQQQAAVNPMQNVVTDTPAGVNPAPYIPGRIHPVELEDADGNVVKDPARVYNQGGTWINQGGFNPITGGTNRMVGSTGYNLLHDNPLGPNSTNPYYNPNYQNPLMGMNVRAQSYAPYMTPNGYVNGYPQNEFDVYLNSVLYNMEPEPMMDVNKMLRNVVLSDEEKEKVNHNTFSGGYVIGYNYYGQPIYNNYNANANYQEEFNKQRRRYQEHFTKLSRICHAYYGEKIDEEKMMERWDPVPKNNTNQQKIFNIYTATPEEKEEYYETMRVANAQEISRLAEKQKMYEESVKAQKAQMFAKIKESHDAMIGVKPGEHYTLSQYLDNGYKIMVANTMDRARQANRTSVGKYDSQAYRLSIVTDPKSNTAKWLNPVSKDDQFASAEDYMKALYIKNKSSIASKGGRTVGSLSQGVRSEKPAETLYIKNGKPEYTSATDPNKDFETMFRELFEDERKVAFNEAMIQHKANIDAKRSGYHEYK